MPVGKDVLSGSVRNGPDAPKTGENQQEPQKATDVRATDAGASKGIPQPVKSTYADIVRRRSKVNFEGEPSAFSHCGHSQKLIPS